MKRPYGLLLGLIIFVAWGRLHAQVPQKLPTRAAIPPPLSKTFSAQLGFQHEGVEVSKLDAPLTLEDIVRISLQSNPTLRQAEFEIQAAEGRARQAGLYPNPTVSVTGDELGDKQGPGGIWTAPQITQEFVLGGKLRLSRAVAERELDQAALALLSQRFSVLSQVRSGFYEVLGTQRRVEILTELTKLVNQAFTQTENLVKAQQAAKLDLLQVQVELNRLRAELEASRRERAAAWGRLVAAMGVPTLPDTALAGSVESELPSYDVETARTFILSEHPEISSARVGVTRAELKVRRAQVEPIPNITAGAGYVRQNQNRSTDWMFQVGLPVPVFNRNQGNIRAAQAELGYAIEGIRRTETTLASRLWTAFGTYSAARERAIRYRSIRDDATQAYKIVLAGFPGQFDVFRLLQAQRTVAEANLEYVRAQTDGWRAAGEIAGLLLQEDWPSPK